MEMSAVTGNELVQVEFDYEYTRDGKLISIKQNEQYVLVSRTNDNWWYVKRLDQSKPFYVPAQYVRQLSTEGSTSPGVQSLNESDSSESQSGGEATDTVNVLKNHCDVGKNHNGQQGQDLCSSDPTQEIKNQINTSPTEYKDTALNLMGNNSPPMVHGSEDSSQSSSVNAHSLPCYSEVHRALVNNKESKNQKSNSAKDSIPQSSAVRVRPKQQANHIQRFSLAGRLGTIQHLSESLNPNHKLNVGKDISPSESFFPPRSASFSHVISSKIHFSLGIGDVRLEHPKPAEKRDSASSKSLPQTPSYNSENVYESIPDLPKPKSKTQKGKSHGPPKGNVNVAHFLSCLSLLFQKIVQTALVAVQLV